MTDAPTPETPEPVRAADLFANGLTRTSVRARHALLTPDGLRVASRLPGWGVAARVIVAVSPAMGARSFTQLHVELPPGVAGWSPDGGGAKGPSRVFYVVTGAVEIAAGKRTETLGAGGFAYVPSGQDWRVKGSVGSGGQLVVFQKPYGPLAGETPPGILFGHVNQCPSAPFLGDPDAVLTTLLPDEPAFDMAVNVFRFAPGAALPFVETHVMEHGLLMLSGRGIYRLEDAWYPVRAGDAIWMAPFCPQWFGALGREGASYLYYKDVNRA